MYSYTDIKHVHLEISTKCNAACPGCPRNLCGVNIINDYPLHDMSLEQAKIIFTPNFLQQLNAIHINGNLGDFVTARDGLAIVEYFKQHNSKLLIEISSNASVNKTGLWPRLAELGVVVQFCIDGLNGTHELYRRYTDWDVIIANAREFIAHGGKAVWKMIKFDHNIDQEQSCRQLSRELGFAEFMFVDHGRNAFPVFDNKKNYLYDIGAHDQPKNFNRIFEIREEGKLEAYKPEIVPCRIKCDAVARSTVYVTATGDVYPCCWLGFYPKTMFHQGQSEIQNLLEGVNNNALEVGFETAMGWFNKVEASWSGQQLEACNSNCSE